MMSEMDDNASVNSDMKEDNSMNLDKYVKDRDSVDTLELIRDSSEFGQDGINQLNEVENTNRDDDQQIDDKTLSNRSTPTLNSRNDEILLDESSLGQVTGRNSVSVETPSRNSIDSSSLSSQNFDIKINPSQQAIVVAQPDTNESKQDSNNPDFDDDEVEVADLVNMEPKLRDAWIKMRKLDKILGRVVKRERLVKKETVALIEKNRVELDLLRLTTDHKESKLEAQNTAHFLALSYVGDLDDEIEKENLSIGQPSTPLFKTQLPEMDESMSQSPTKRSSHKSENDNEDEQDDVDPTKTNKTTNSSSSTKQSKNNKSSSISSSKKNTNNSSNAATSNEKNFIKRNIQLAQDAGGTLAMTDEEKHRLNELLLDLDDLDSNKQQRPQITETNETNNNGDSTYLVEYNPFAVCVAQGDGFTPDKGDLERLRLIDSKLEGRNNSRLTTTFGNSSCATLNDNNHRNSTFSLLSTAKLTKSVFSAHNIDADSYAGILDTESKQIKLNDDFDENEFGDKFIREARLTREQETRLKQIEIQLARLKSSSSTQTAAAAADAGDSCSSIDNESSSNHRSSLSQILINQEQLKLLLDECLEENQIFSTNPSKRLNTLREEDDASLDSAGLGSENSRLISVSSLPDSTIQSLINQAKSEFGLDQIDRNNNTMSPVHSFYEEALEIIKSRPQISFRDDLYSESDQLVPNLDEPEHTINNRNSKLNNSDTRDLISSPIQNQLRPISSRSSSRNTLLASIDQEQPNYQLNRYNKLPPLAAAAASSANNNSKDESNNSLLLNDEDPERSQSTISNSNSTSSSSVYNNSISFPKIDIRFLPKK